MTIRTSIPQSQRHCAAGVHTGSNPADALTRSGCELAAQRMDLELEEAVWWISKCPAGVQKLLPRGSGRWFQRSHQFWASVGSALTIAVTCDCIARSGCVRHSAANEHVGCWLVGWGVLVWGGVGLCEAPVRMMQFTHHPLCIRADLTGVFSLSFLVWPSRASTL